MTQAPKPKLITVAEAMDQLGINRAKIYELMSSGDIAYIKFPPHTRHAGRRIEQAEVDAFIARNRSAVAT